MADTLSLNSLKPGAGSKSSVKRVGRGIGSGLGKTCARGHKGQKSRSGGYHKVGFEGGQMPIQRRLPKIGFRSRVSLVNAEVRLSELAKVDADVIDLDALKAAGVLNGSIKKAKIFLSGAIERPVTIKGLAVTKGAKAAIEKAGGKIEAAE